MFKVSEKILPFGATPDERQINHMNMEKKVFFHFGINSFSNVEWGNGKEDPAAFAPKKVDTDQWIRVAKDAGFKLAILTAKHHDGFCLWQTAYSEHSIKNSPYQNGKGDIVRQFTDSCRKYGLKVGIYISPWDRNSPYWGKSEYSDYYADQLTELVTNYGEIDEIWWDGAGSGETEYNWKLWADIISKHQPKALIFGPTPKSFGSSEYVSLRWVGNERGFAGKTHYASIDPDSDALEKTANLNTGKIGGVRYLPAEVDVSVRPGWFYHASQRDMVKTPRDLDDIWFHSVGRNAIMLLNFPPNTDGIIEEPDATRAIQSNQRIEKMLEKDFALGASVKTSVAAFSEETDAENLTDGSYDTFFASKETDKEAVFEISLPQKARFNVLSVSEVFELGERITEFEVKNKETGEVIATGTSVGRKKMLRFPYVETSKIELYVKAEAQLVLRSISLYDYVAPEESGETQYGGNLLELDGASVELSDGGKEARLVFGGVYDYNYVQLKLTSDAPYEIFAFDGTNYYSVAKRNGNTSLQTVALDTVKGSYQLKIKADAPFDTNHPFSVFMKK